MAAVEEDAAGEGELLPGGVGVVGQRGQHLLLGEFDQLVLGNLHGGRHGRYLHGKGQWVADGQVTVIRTQCDLNDTKCHMQAMCHRFSEKQACAKTCYVVTFGLVLGAWGKMRMEKAAVEGLQAGQVSVRRQGRSGG